VEDCISVQQDCSLLDGVTGRQATTTHLSQFACFALTTATQKVFVLEVLSIALSWSLQVKLLFVVSIAASVLQRCETYSCSLASLGGIFNDSMQIDLVKPWRFAIG